MTEPLGVLPSARSLLSRPRVLVVDDDQDLVALLASWLDDVGVVYQATTSAQALAVAEGVALDLAVVDIVLPRMDGFELVEALHARPGLAGVPVVFITGSHRADLLARAEEFGRATVLQKPVRCEVLHEAVLGLLRPPAATV